MANLQALRRKIGSVKNTQKNYEGHESWWLHLSFVGPSNEFWRFAPTGKNCARVLANLSGRVNRSAHPFLQKT